MSEMNNATLVKSIRVGYTRFKALLAEFNEEQMTRPGSVGQWSIKDTVAHIVVHQQRMIRWMEERLRGGLPATPQPYNMPDEELDQLNERIYQENRDRLLDEILLDFEKIHIETLAFLESNPEEALFNRSCFHLQGGEPLWEAIAANTFWHYEEHGQEIRRWQYTVQQAVS